jgi:hypothetical protein
MKVIIYSFVILSCSLLAPSCDNGNDPKKEIDVRLVGGKWYNDRGNSNPNSFYRFTETTYGVASNGEETIILTPAYSENGKILAINNGAVLLHYEFITASYYDVELAEAIASGDHLKIYNVEIKINAAKNGNMVKFIIPGSTESFEWARWGNVILNPNAKIPSFFHGTWYRIGLVGYSMGKGFDTQLLKIVIDDTSLTVFGYDHFVSDPKDITFYSDDYFITYYEDLNVSEVVFNTNYSYPFIIKNSDKSWNGSISLSTTAFGITYEPEAKSYIYLKESSGVFMPEWAVGNYSVTNYSYNSLRYENYPFYTVIYDFVFRNIGFAHSVEIKEYRGYDPWVWSSTWGNYWFIQKENFGNSSFLETDKTIFYFDEYFLERDLNSSQMYFGSTNEENIFYPKVPVYRRADLPR